MKNNYFETHASYRAAWEIWFKANHPTLSKLHDDFLRETGKTRYDAGCSYSEFCVELFAETADGISAAEKCNPERN